MLKFNPLLKLNLVLIDFFSLSLFPFVCRAPFGETLSMFAEAINTQAHLELFISLASAAGLDADDDNVSETIATIEENIRWINLKAPEIEDWANGAFGLKFSVLAVLAALIFVQLFK